MSNHLAVIVGVFLVALALEAVGSDAETVKHEEFNGYFVSTKFEPDAAESFVAIHDQKQFDEVFGVAFVMGDKSHRLPKGAFANTLILGVVKRGTATWDYKVQKVLEKDGELEIQYTAKASPQVGATFVSPLIVGVPKKEFKSVKFVEGLKEVKTLKLKE